MLFLFFCTITLIVFLFIPLTDLCKENLQAGELDITYHRFIDRLNKEKYLEETGNNAMNDPW